jgi:hypothetical protein
VTLFSTEAEYTALLEMSKEIIIISEVLKFMNIIASYPIDVDDNNFWAIYLAKNAFTTTRAKYIDI